MASGADAEKVSAKASNATNKAASAQGGTVASGNNNQQGSNTGSSTGNTTQTHQHNWVPQTTTAHHDAVYKTETSYIHHDAVYETRTVSVCVTCGAENPSLQHSKNHALNGQSDQVREVEKKVLVKNAYDEPVTKQVLVSAAYDETVTTGYKCSDCGATKSN